MFHLPPARPHRPFVLCDHGRPGSRNNSGCYVCNRVSRKKAQHSILSAYEKATQSARRDNLFAQVLLACALAPKTELGYFSATGVRYPMSRLMGKPYEIPAFARHLNEFVELHRGRS